MGGISDLKYKKRITSLVGLPTKFGQIPKFQVAKPDKVIKHELPPIPGVYQVGISIKVELGDPWAELFKTQRALMKAYGMKPMPDFPYYSELTLLWKVSVKPDLSFEVLAGRKVVGQKKKLYFEKGLDVGFGIPFVKGTSFSIDLINTADSSQTVVFTPDKTKTSVALGVVAKHNKHQLLNHTFTIELSLPKPKKTKVPPKGPGKKKDPAPDPSGEKPKKLKFKKVNFVVGPFVTNSSKMKPMDKKVAKKVKGALDAAGLTKELSKLSEATKDLYTSGNRPDGFKNIVIKGYADTRGTIEHNRGLSLERAKAVKARMQGDLGAPDGFFSPLQKGEGPKPNKDTEPGEANPNARIVTIEMLVVK